MTTSHKPASRKVPVSQDNLQAELTAAEELAAFGVWRWARGSRIVTGTAGFMRIFGLGADADSAAARPLLRRMTPANRRDLFAALRAALPVTIELAVADSGNMSRGMFSIALRSDGNGFWGVAHDVTALRTAVKNLGETEYRWEVALESAGQAMWDSNLETGEVYHSRTWRVMRGMNPDGDVNDSHENWASRLHPEDAPRILATIAREHTGEVQNVALEYRERKPDGNYIWVSSFGRPIEFFPDGRPKRIIGTDTDITQRKRDEDERDRLARRLQLALEVSELGVFEANLVTREVYWDKRVRQIYGLSDDFEVTPSYWETSLHPDDFDSAMRRVWAAVESRGTYVSDFRIIRPSGETRNVHTVGIWYQDADGVPKLLGVNWDVTEEVAAKRDLERARNLAEARNAELEDAKGAIEHNALHDALTGLPNRRYLDAHLAKRAAAAAETGGPVSLLHIDLDLFKQINDTLGHIAGDAMLMHVAALLREATGPDDFVARVGGDEFSIVTGLSATDARLETLAHEIISKVRRPVPYEGHYCRFGASIGIAARMGKDVDPQRLLIDADIALYRAKGRGKNRYEFFTEALQAETVNTKRVADDIMMGIEQDEFFPHYQPLFDAQTMALVGVEALARWRHPIRGVLPPAAFLKIAEDLNVVTAIDRVILETSLGQFNRWRAEGLEVPSISVNVSFRRLHDQQLMQSLETLSIAPGTVSFELLESIFLDEVDDIVSWNIDQIRELGIDINIDDFGTGHASIISLLKLRPKRFKLDRAFLDSLTESPAQQRLVRSIIDIGKSLGIKVVAEGVESMEQATILRELGCDILQGFAFARPMPADQFELFVRNRSWRKAS
jgi:diguanylate cyclase (GGDEF)-like protein/PAS domain S-box-containing protein